jgi:hypothetical protein
MEFLLVCCLKVFYRKIAKIIAKFTYPNLTLPIHIGFVKRATSLNFPLIFYRSGREIPSFSWIVFLAGAVLSLFAVREWTFVQAGYSLCLIPPITLVVCLSVRRSKTKISRPAT